MAITIKPDALAATVADLLNEYGDECTDILEDAVKKAAKQAANELKSAGSFGGSGKYRKGWKAKTEKNRVGVEGVVYNSTAPGLAHLLEFGHAIKRGGRKVGSAAAFPHIAPINEKAQAELVEELERKL